MEKSLPNDIISVTTRKAWHAWLDKNHDRKESVWIVFHKKHTGAPSLPYDDAVEEALCYGWIDSLVRRLDEDRYIQKFTPRRAKSAWSPANKKRVRAMIRQGKMTEAGLAKIREAKKDGSWNRLDAVDALGRVPAELAAAFKTEPDAAKAFGSRSPSLKKQFLWFIETARRNETREKRVAVVVKLLKKSETMSDYFYRRAA